MRTTSGNDWIWLSSRFAILARDDFRCIACGSDEDLSLDHVNRKGRSNHKNLVTLCKRCNSSKGIQTYKEWRPELVDVVLRQLASPIDRRLGRLLAEEYRPGRLAQHAFRNSPEERARRARAREAAVDSFFDGFAEDDSVSRAS